MVMSGQLHSPAAFDVESHHRKIIVTVSIDCMEQVIEGTPL
jgi:hypothetical protein